MFCFCLVVDSGGLLFVYIVIGLLGLFVRDGYVIKDC